MSFFLTTYILFCYCIIISYNQWGGWAKLCGNVHFWEVMNNYCPLWLILKTDIYSNRKEPANISKRWLIMYIFHNFTILLYDIIGFIKRDRERERKRERELFIVQNVTQTNS